jgi:outer membrane protein OmpA-like peptidoglycan-associated protein
MRLGQEGQQQGGQQDASARNTSPGSMSGGDARSSQFTGDARQMANQAQQLANDTRDLRRDLSQAGVGQRELQPIDELAKALQAMSDEKAYGDPKGIQQLYATALDKFKKLEYDLRKRTDTSNQQLFLSGSDDVPPKFKSLIEEYSRALSKKPAAGGGGK